MDVCCENCGTEYELDEGRLKGPVVKVKCSDCGHTFQVQSPSHSGAVAIHTAEPDEHAGPTTLAGMPATLPDDMSSLGASATESSSQPTMSASFSAVGLPGPSEQTLPAAATTPTTPGGPISQVSTGPAHPRAPSESQRKRPMSSGPLLGPKTWLIRLDNGEVKNCRELATLQQWIVAGLVTRECQISRNGRTWKILGNIAELRQYFDIAEEAVELRRRRSGSVERVAEGRAQYPRGSSQPVADAPSSADITISEDAPGPGGPPVSPHGSQSIPTVVEDEHSWKTALGGVPGARQEPSQSQGPTGGMSRSIPTHDAAFTRNPSRSSVLPLPEEVIEFGDDDLVEPTGSRTGTWLVIVAMLVLVGAGAFIYFYVLRGGSPGVSAHADAGGDAATVVAIADAASSTQDDPDVAAATIAYDHKRLRTAVQKFVEAEPARDSDAWARRAQAAVALAQSFQDRMTISGRADRKTKRQVVEYARLATKWADKARDLTRQHGLATVVKADAMRLLDQSRRAVRGMLRSVKRKHEVDVRLVEGLLNQRGKRLREARKTFRQLSGRDAVKQMKDTRALYRLALLEFAAGDLAKARQYLENIVSIDAEHMAAQALISKIDASVSVDATDPLPTETQAAAGSGDTYNGLLDQADKKQKNGQCKAAVALYTRALDLQNGIEAHVGLGYCHMDLNSYARARSDFRAALAISPRYRAALYGIAESYQYEGRKEKAIEAYKDYIDEHPDSAQARQAKKQIDRLGGKVEPKATNPPTTPSEEHSSRSPSGSAPEASTTTGGSQPAIAPKADDDEPLPAQPSTDDDGPPTDTTSTE